MAAASNPMPTKRRLLGGKLALAIALASGTVLTATALEAPAFAQKKKKAPKADYSKAFVEAYRPAQEKLNDASADPASLLSFVSTLAAAASTDDDKMAAGNAILNIGTKNSNPSLQRQGLDMMLSSGKVAADELGRLTSIAGQLAYNLNDFPAARQRFEQALALGYTKDDPEATIAETYFQEDNHAAGLTYLAGAVDKRVAAGQPVNPSWLRRGLAMAYNNDQTAHSIKFANLYVKHAPSPESWNDAVAITLNTNNYDPQAVLDLLRVARANKVLKTPTYMEYIESADARRMPGEVLAVIEEGYADGSLDRSDPFVTEARATATRQRSADQADLPALERDAMASGAGLRTVMAAGDAFLNYNEYAKAEALYSKALTLPGVNSATALTRLGIAQLRLGKGQEALASFAKVQGPRKAIADLWAVHTEQKLAPAPTVPEVATIETPAGS